MPSREMEQVMNNPSDAELRQILAQHDLQHAVERLDEADNLYTRDDVQQALARYAEELAGEELLTRKYLLGLCVGVVGSSFTIFCILLVWSWFSR